MGFHRKWDLFGYVHIMEFVEQGQNHRPGLLQQRFLAVITPHLNREREAFHQAGVLFCSTEN